MPICICVKLNINLLYLSVSIPLIWDKQVALRGRREVRMSDSNGICDKHLAAASVICNKEKKQFKTLIYDLFLKQSTKYSTQNIVQSCS